MTRSNLAAAALAGAMLGAGAAQACTLQTVGELDLDLSRRAPVVEGEINGVAAKIMIDTGSDGTSIMAPAARALGLMKDRLPQGYVFAIGGDTQHYVTTIRSLKIGSLTATALPPMLVGGELKGEPDIAMLVGSDFLSQFDVELDFANHVMRLFHAEDCSPAQLVYWNKPYSQAALLPGNSIQTEVALNGRRALAWVDTGASGSLVDADEALAAGEPRPAQATLAASGLGPEPRLLWADDFASFQIGDETIAQAHINVSPFAHDFEAIELDSHISHRTGDTPGMLVGDDFLRAHRVMVDYRDHVMVFSYNGGPIFATGTAPPRDAR